MHSVCVLLLLPELEGNKFSSSPYIDVQLLLGHVCVRVCQCEPVCADVFACGRRYVSDGVYVRV